MLARFSVKKPYTVVVGVLLALVLGVISFMNMTTDLLPSMNLPYVVVYTTYIGATPEVVEDAITRPMEAAFATLTGVVGLSSTSSDSVSIIVLEFSGTANMDTAMIEISSEVDKLRGDWSDSVGMPVILKINPDMLPVAVVSVGADSMDIHELSDYVTNELVPELEAIEGVASVTASGIVTEEITVTIEQSRIDILNSAILRDLDAELADVEAEINDAQRQISEGKATLASERKKALSQIDSGLEQVRTGSENLASGIRQVEAQRAQLVSQLAEVEAGIAQLDQLSQSGEQAMAQLAQLNSQLSNMRTQKSLLEANLRALDTGADPSVQADYDAAVSRRADLVSQRDGYQDYLDDLTLLDPNRIQAQLDAKQQELTQANAELMALNGRRTQVAGIVSELEKQLAAMETEAPPTDPIETETAESTETNTTEPSETETTEPTETNTAEPTETNTAEPTETNTAEPTETNTAEPTETNTAEPTETNTAEPTETNAAVPTETNATEPAETKAAEPIETETAEQSDQNSVELTDEQTSQPPTEPPANTPEAEDTKAPEPNEPEDASLLIAAAHAAGASREELEAQLRQARQALLDVDADILAKNAQINAINSRIDQLTAALAEIEGEGEDVTHRAEEAQANIDSLNEQIAELDGEISELAAKLMSDDQREAERVRLRSQIAQIDANITAITGSPEYQALLLAADADALAAQYAQLNGAKLQLEAGIAQTDDMLRKLNAGIVPGGFIEGIDEDTNLKDAEDELVAARSMVIDKLGDASAQLAEADDEIAKARKEFNEKRDEAYENAGLDGVITLRMISGIIGAQNFSMPAGYVYEKDDSYMVRVGDKFKSLDELKRLKLFSLGLDSIDEVRLLDVASVELTDDSEDVFTKVNGADGVMLSFEKQSNYATAEVAQRITEKTKELTAGDAGIKIYELMNQGTYIKIVIDAVLSNLLYGAILAILVLFLFLGDIKPTIIVALSIPISVVVAFVAMYFTGITLNVLSLSGLALGIGMLVDNSIVAIENIYRLRNEEKMPVMRACVEGIKQVSGALVASTLTTICVFLPIVFVTGLARDLFSDIGLTIAYSLMGSLVVAMTLVPTMAATLLKRPNNRSEKVNRRQRGMRRVYGKMLKAALRAKALVLVVAVVLMLYSGWRVLNMNMSFMPDVNSDQMMATIKLDAEMKEKEAQELALTVMNEIMQVKGIDSIGVSSGSLMTFSRGGSSSTMTYYMTVKPGSGRSNSELVDEIDALGPKFNVEIEASASTMDITMLSGSGVSVDITGSEVDTLLSIAAEVADVVRSVEGTKDVTDGTQDTVPELSIVVDKDRANEEGLTVAQVYQFIAEKLLRSTEITEVTLNDKDLKVNVVVGENLKLVPEDIENLEIEVEDDEEARMVRIGDISDILDAESMTSIARENQRRTVSVTFGVDGERGMNIVSRELEKKLEGYVLPDGYEINMSGENETVMVIINDLLFMVGIAVALIFLIMVAQFQSFKSPIIVMFTIPLAFTGGLLALLITGMDLSVISMIGFLVLSGVIVNNGIVFIDCINQLRIGGMKKRAAIIRAGKMRLRPILMTALTTILGMSTLALGTGMGAEMMQPMAVVSIGGLTYATFMTLFVVPILYDLFNGEKLRAREIDMMREAAGLRDEEEVMNGGDAPKAEAKELPAADEKPSA